MKKIICLLLTTSITIGCSTTATYVPIVDPSSMANKNYESDYELCKQATDQVDYSSEENRAAIRGGLTGVGVVGAGAGIVAGTGGIVLASVALPLAAIGGGIAAVTSKNRKSKEEQKLRAIVFDKCLENRGYEVLSKRE